MPKTGDAWGRMLLDCHGGRHGAIEMVEREDGFIEPGSGIGYFEGPTIRDPIEREGLALARGHVLDVGAGAGRHALYLQREGLTVTAIDPSPGAVEVCRARGVADARETSIQRLPVSAGPFDSVIMLGNNFGVFGSRRGAVTGLRKLARMTTPGAVVIAGTNNIYQPGIPRTHRAYQRSNRARGRMPGQIRLRVRYRDLATPWFDYLMVSPAELRSICRETPWRVQRLLGDPRGLYVAVLHRP